VAVEGSDGAKATQETNYRTKTVSFVAFGSGFAVRGNKGLMTMLTARARMPMSGIKWQGKSYIAIRNGGICVGNSIIKCSVSAIPGITEI
jgi:hypothetical protein